MSTNIIHKKTAVAGRVPTTSQLQYAELAVNTVDGKLYTKINDGSDRIIDLSSDRFVFDVVNNAASSYDFTGVGLTSEPNPTLFLLRGFTYEFRLNASGHPFYIKTVSGTGSTNLYTSGVSGNGAQTGIVYFTVPMDAPDTLYYNCEFHSSMAGELKIIDQGINYTDLSVTTAAASGGGSLTYNNVNGVFTFTPPSLALADLTNVSSTAPATGEVLKWDGSQWAPATDATAGGTGLDADTLDGQHGTYYLDYTNFTNTPTIPTVLTDLSITDGTSGQVLTTDGAGNFSFTTVSGGGGIALTDLSVTTGSAVAGGQLLYNNTTGVFTFSPATQVTSIDDLSDVDITSTAPTDGQALIWDAATSKFLPGTVSTGGGGGATSVIAPFAFGYIDSTSGTGTGLSWGNWNSGTGVLDVTFSTAQPDTDYAVVTDGEYQDDGRLATVYGKTTTGFSLQVYDVNGNVVTPNTSNGQFTVFVYGSNPTISLASGGGASAINDLSDVDTVTSPPANGEALIWNSTSSQWEPGTTSTVGSIDDLSDVDITSTAPTIGQVLKWDGTNFVPGNDLNTGSGGGSTVYGELSVLSDSFTGDGSTTNYTLSQLPSSENHVIVALNGVVQDPSTYSMSGQDVVFATAPALNDNVELRSFKYGSTDVVLRDYQVYKYTIGSNVTSVSGADDNAATLAYDVGKVEVFVNGVRLVNGDDYTATDGTSIAFGETVFAGSVVEVVSLAKAAIFAGLTPIDSDQVSIATTNQTAVATFPASSFRTAKLIVQMSHASAGYHSTEVLLIHDGTDVYTTEYATIYTTASLGTIDASIISGIVTITVTPTNTNTDVRTKRLSVEV